MKKQTTQPQVGQGKTQAQRMAYIMETATEEEKKLVKEFEEMRRRPKAR